MRVRKARKAERQTDRWIDIQINIQKSRHPTAFIVNMIAWGARANLQTRHLCLPIYTPRERVVQTDSPMSKTVRAPVAACPPLVIVAAPSVRSPARRRTRVWAVPAFRDRSSVDNGPARRGGYARAGRTHARTRDGRQLGFGVSNLLRVVHLSPSLEREKFASRPPRLTKRAVATVLARRHRPCSILGPLQFIYESVGCSRVPLL